MARFKKTIKKTELKQNTAIAVEIGKTDVAIVNAAGEIFAIDNFCRHRGGPLAEGCVSKNKVIVCPWHGWQFDLESGLCLNYPSVSQKTFPVKIKDDYIYIALDE